MSLTRQKYDSLSFSIQFCSQKILRLLSGDKNFEPTFNRREKNTARGNQEQQQRFEWLYVQQRTSDPDSN